MALGWTVLGRSCGDERVKSFSSLSPRWLFVCALPLPAFGAAAFVPRSCGGHVLGLERVRAASRGRGRSSDLLGSQSGNEQLQEICHGMFLSHTSRCTERKRYSRALDGGMAATPVLVAAPRLGGKEHKAVHIGSPVWLVETLRNIDSWGRHSPSPNRAGVAVGLIVSRWAKDGVRADRKGWEHCGYIDASVPGAALLARPSAPSAYGPVLRLLAILFPKQPPKLCQGPARLGKTCLRCCSSSQQGLKETPQSAEY